MAKKNWIIIYRGFRKGDYPIASAPQSKQQAKDLFLIHNDAEYLVKIKKTRTETKL